MAFRLGQREVGTGLGLELPQPFPGLADLLPLRLPTAVRFQRQRGLTTTALLKTADLRPKEQGQPETLDYRVFLVDGGDRKLSPWHDVPLRAGDGAFHFIVEIPKESSAKMEVATDEAFTPIKQDTKKGNLRYYP